MLRKISISPTSSRILRVTPGMTSNLKLTVKIWDIYHINPHNQSRWYVWLSISYSNLLIIFFAMIADRKYPIVTLFTRASNLQVIVFSNNLISKINHRCLQTHKCFNQSSLMFCIRKLQDPIINTITTLKVGLFVAYEMIICWYHLALSVDPCIRVFSRHVKNVSINMECKE